MDLGMSEILVIAIVALVVIGPKDLPEMFRQLGRMTAKLRAMSREFSRAMEQAANETGVKDVAKDLKAATSPKAMGVNAVKDAVDRFEKWDPIKNAAKPTKPPTGGPLVPPAMPPTLTPPTIMPPPMKPPPWAAAEAAPPAEPAAPAAPAPGPNTAALYDKKAARAAILRESAAKLKALDAGPVTAAQPAAKPAARAKKAAAVAIPAEASAATPPARPARKKKVAEE